MLLSDTTSKVESITSRYTAHFSVIQNFCIVCVNFRSSQSFLNHYSPQENLNQVHTKDSWASIVLLIVEQRMPAPRPPLTPKTLCLTLLLWELLLSPRGGHVLMEIYWAWGGCSWIHQEKTNHFVQHRCSFESVRSEEQWLQKSLCLGSLLYVVTNKPQRHHIRLPLLQTGVQTQLEVDVFTGSTSVSESWVYCLHPEKFNALLKEKSHKSKDPLVALLGPDLCLSFL